MSEYTPITATQFRVVHLLPGKFDEHIQCILETRSSDVKTSYEALSYEWGAGSVATRLIDIAHYPALSRAATTSDAELSSSVGYWNVKVAWHAVQETTIRYTKFITCALALLCAFPLWRLFSWFDSPPWSKWIISRDWYMALLSLLVSHSIVDVFIRLPLEIVRTKPWLLALDRHNFLSVPKLEFGTFVVTPNLELALRHLRLSKRRRTLWIDALCINQENEAEKTVQIQRMDAIYANATSVRIWLGDCHGIGATSTCPQLLDSSSHPCTHEREIRRAFDFIYWARRSRLGRIRRLLDRRDRGEIIRDALPGLLSIVQRGWWRRLWVIQEAALGTGDMYIQCGFHTCEFHWFQRAQSEVLKSTSLDPVAQEAFRSTRRFLSTIADFRYYESQELDRDADSATNLFYEGLNFVIGSVAGRRLDFGQRPAFHKQSFSYRLLLVLLHTAGHFDCRTEKDRLSAVLGIVGGTRQAPSVVAGIFRTVTSPSTVSTFLTARAQTRAAFQDEETPSFLPSAISTFLLLELSGFCHERVKSWTLGRPKYVMTDYRDVLDAVGDKHASESDSGSFFCALARYLARKTGSLAFLEAAPCEQIDGMPSWAPTWTRVVHDSAYDFARASKQDMAQDAFIFMHEGTTLSVSGQYCGSVRSVRAIDEAVLQSELLECLSEVLYVLPKILTASAARVSLSTVQVLLCDGGMPDKIDAMLKSNQIWEDLRGVAKGLIEAHGRTVLHYAKRGDGGVGEVGYVKAGQIQQGDRIVSVPGCFHDLALRGISTPAGRGSRWRLVGLVYPVERHFERDGKPGFTKAEWERLYTEQKLNRFDIV